MSQSTEKPTIVFVHGAWHNSSCWNSVRKTLEGYSYPTVAVDLPSVGRKPPVTSHLEDTAIVRNELERLILVEGREVILVMHSYGGIAGGGAVSGLEKAARQDKGGVTQCIFIAAFLVPKGSSLLGMFDNKFPPYLEVDPQDSEYLIVKNPAETFYSDISPDVSEPWTSQMRPQSYASFQSSVESVCWENGLTPCTYMICELDQGVYLPLQKMMLEKVAKEGQAWTIETCNSGHSPWLSQTPAVTRLIRTTAGEEVV